MANHLKQGAVGCAVSASVAVATSLALRVRQVGIVEAGTAGALEFAAYGAGRTTKAFSNGSGGHRSARMVMTMARSWVVKCL